MIDEEELDHFALNFLGYGDETAPIWFIGPEESGGRSIDEVQNRLTAWRERGFKPVEDLAEFHDSFMKPHKYTSLKYQPTWGKIIRAILVAGAAKPTLQEVKDFQREHLGRHGSSTCLLELMPLPAPSMREIDWPYGSFLGSGSLKSRKEYLARYWAKRVDLLQNLVRQQKPSFVVFYGKSYPNAWRRIAGGDFELQDGYEISNSAETTFFRIAHPVARGGSNLLWEGMGEKIRVMSEELR